MYKIMGRYQGKTEEVDSAKTRKYAEYLLEEYRLAYGSSWYLYIRRARKDEE